MKDLFRATLSLLIVSALLIASEIGAAEISKTPTATNNAQELSATVLMGGVGGVYFYAQPGELIIEVEKRDRNRRNVRTELRAILAGPDRRVLQEQIIPGDGQSSGSGVGPVQRCRFVTRVETAGVYVLNITTSRDRYGLEAFWGFRSNCKQYLIETARGHRDAAHEEPIVLLSPERPTNICFLPREGSFSVEISDLPKSAASLEMFDGNGKLIATLPATAGRVSHQFAADIDRNATPWRLHFPSAEAVVHIDGLTRWNNDDSFPNMTVWTPDPDSWFSFLENRWMLTPYNRTTYGTPGGRREIAFQVHNNSDRSRAFDLAIEFPEKEWPAHLETGRVLVNARSATNVTLHFTMPNRNQTRSARIRSTPVDDPQFTTYSTLTAKAGTAPAAKPLATPLLLKPYEHENQRFGYLPDYPVERQMYFDLHNRPFVSIGDRVMTLRDKEWSNSFLSPVLGVGASAYPAAKIAFDKENDIYLLASTPSTPTLQHSTDGGKSFTAYPIPGRPAVYDIEQFSGHNVPDGPPPFLRYTFIARDETVFWRKVNKLELFLPRKENGRIVIGDPIPISDECIGLSVHSGNPSSIVSRGSKVHVTWGEATDPKVEVPGVPVYVATYDRESGKLGKPTLVAHGAPANDSHNTPSITMDKKGYLHVLGGTHGRPFPYVQSLKPNDAGSGWTEPTFLGELNQTYIGLVCGPDDTLHCVFRLWRHETDPHPASTHATLAYQRKPPGKPWEKPQVLIASPFSEYSVFYHRLTIDRKGRLFLSYDYWSTFWFYRNDQPSRERSVLMSANGGKTWKLAEGKDLR
ncbi:MAG: BNR-4 repeat-containing protein [Verrucomicrobia bacterium]|nr:BNR-4 repeat-containing protein [Verrucomicrobiota bacterium]